MLAVEMELKVSLLDCLIHWDQVEEVANTTLAYTQCI